MVSFEIKDSVGLIKLNRPEKYNSVTYELAQAVQDALTKCEDDSVRCVFLTGVGKTFCAGQDLNEAMDTDTRSAEEIVIEQYNPIVLKMINIEKPVICAVNGMAIGAGANLALSADIVVAKESAYFCQAFSQISLIPDTGGTWILPRLVGMARAKALMMTAERVYAPEAEAMGMIYKSIPDDQFEEESWKLALRLASMPTKGLGLTKRVLNHSYTTDLENQLSIEARIQAVAFNLIDCKEGMLAFKEKRKPQFVGN